MGLGLYWICVLPAICWEDNSDTDEWFDALNQVLPLEDKLGEDTLEKLKALPQELERCCFCSLPNISHL